MFIFIQLLLLLVIFPCTHITLFMQNFVCTQIQKVKNNLSMKAGRVSYRLQNDKIVCDDLFLKHLNVYFHFK